jgi:exopolyphosphatase/guanosine-5'-triphosphate,3'-diphosphate pyrophosphatase
MARPKKLTRKPAADVPPPPPEPLRPLAVLDIGASAIRLTVAEAPEGEPIRILEQASRGVLLGNDTFTHGRLGGPTVEATLKALEGFRRIMDTYGVVRYRAVATSAVREATNRETFLDRVRLRTGIDVEIIDGSEENRLTYMAVRETIRDHPSLPTADALLVEVGGGSADISFLRKGEPIHSGTYALGSIRLRQNFASWHGGHDQWTRLLRRHIHNVVEDIRREMPLREARHMLALGGDVRFAAEQITGEPMPRGTAARHSG